MSYQRNLLEETLQVLTLHGKTPQDVICVRSHADQQGTWEDFVKLSDFTYDSGYGGNEVVGSLAIIGDDWWMSRGEYDGSEWWNFCHTPMPLKTFKPLETLRED